MQNSILTYSIKSLRESVKFSYGRQNLNEFEFIECFAKKKHVLPRCKLAKFSIVIQTKAAIQCSVNDNFENLRGAMKGFLLKPLRNTLEQVHFYRHCRPVNRLLAKK